MWGTITACLASYYFGFYTFAIFMLRFNKPLLTDKDYNNKYTDVYRTKHYKQL